jgi:hypothetical protein
MVLAALINDSVMGIVDVHALPAMLEFTMRFVCCIEAARAPVTEPEYYEQEPISD